RGGAPRLSPLAQEIGPAPDRNGPPHPGRTDAGRGRGHTAKLGSPGIAGGTRAHAAPSPRSDRNGDGRAGSAGSASRSGRRPRPSERAPRQDGGLPFLAPAPCRDARASSPNAGFGARARALRLGPSH